MAVKGWCHYQKRPEGLLCSAEVSGARIYAIALDATLGEQGATVAPPQLQAHCVHLLESFLSEHAVGVVGTFPTGIHFLVQSRHVSAVVVYLHASSLHLGGGGVGDGRLVAGSCAHDGLALRCWHQCLPHVVYVGRVREGWPGRPRHLAPVPVAVEDGHAHQLQMCRHTWVRRLRRVVCKAEAISLQRQHTHQQQHSSSNIHPYCQIIERRDSRGLFFERYRPRDSTPKQVDDRGNECLVKVENLCQ